MTLGAGQFEFTVAGVGLSLVALTALSGRTVN